MNSSFLHPETRDSLSLHNVFLSAFQLYWLLSAEFSNDPVQAELIYLDIQIGPKAIEIKVVDDGIGLENPESKEGHYGLQNMRARMG